MGIESIKRNYVVCFLILCISISVLAATAYFKRNSILNKKQQQMMTPDQALQTLIDGNKRFYSNTTVERYSPVALSQKASELGQFPKAVILACMDSRSIPEIVFDQSVGDIFTLRIAGNVVNDEMIASLEYATKHSGSKLIVIMGHTQCGAIQAACNGLIVGYLEALVYAIEPAVSMIKKQSPNQQLDCTDATTISRVVMQNVRNMIERVTQKSRAIRELLSQGKIKIVGALHNLETGVVTFE